MATGPLRATTIFIVILNLSVYVTILALAGWAVDTSIDGNPSQGNSIPHSLSIQFNFHFIGGSICSITSVESMNQNSYSLITYYIDLLLVDQSLLHIHRKQIFLT